MVKGADSPNFPKICSLFLYWKSFDNKETGYFLPQSLAVILADIPPLPEDPGVSRVRVRNKFIANSVSIYKKIE